MDDGTEISHANELLIFAKWCIVLFNKEAPPAELLRDKLSRGSTVKDTFELKTHIWSRQLVQFERELGALGYCVETSMAIALSMFRECKERLEDPEDTIINRVESDKKFQRKLRMDEADRAVDDIKKGWEPSTLDSAFILNAERQFKKCIERLRE